MIKAERPSGIRVEAKEKLSLQDWLLISYYTAGALLEEFLDSAYTPRPSLSDPSFDYKETNAWKNRPRPARSALFRLLKKKLLVVEGSGRARRYLVNEAGLEYLFAKFPKLKYQRYKWDEKWRLVVYDIQESKSRLRYRLRSELRKLGFIHVQKSVWLTPFPVEKALELFLKSEGLWGRILVFKATLPPPDTKKLLKIFFGGSPFSRFVSPR